MKKPVYILVSIIALCARISLATTLTDELWNENVAIYEKIKTMPFNVELSNGSLNEEKFRYYIIQDYFYLKNYIKVFEILISKSKDKDTTDFLQNGIKSVNEEIKTIHDVYFKKFNISDADVENSEIEPYTELYMSFLIKTATLEPLPVGLSAILPCYWIYYNLGDYISKKNINNKNKYYDWVKNYSSEDWETSTVKKLVDIINKNANNATEGTKRKMKLAYKTSSRLEYLFWDAAYNNIHWPK